MQWKTCVFTFPILIYALVIGGIYRVGGEAEHLMNERVTSNLSEVIDETINQAIEDYEKKLNYMDIQKNIGYSKNDK